MTDHELLELCFTLADEAGRAILAIRARGFATTLKDDASPVTEADHAAERIIEAGLRRAAPQIPVVAEEAMAAHARTRCAALDALLAEDEGVHKVCIYTLCIYKIFFKGSITYIHMAVSYTFK